MLPLAGKWVEAARSGWEDTSAKTLGGAERNGISSDEAQAEERGRQHQQEKAMYKYWLTDDDVAYYDDVRSDEDADGHHAMGEDRPAGSAHHTGDEAPLTTNRRGERLPPLTKNEILAERRYQGLPNDLQAIDDNWYRSSDDDRRMSYEEVEKSSDSSYVVEERGPVTEKEEGEDLAWIAGDDQLSLRVRRKPVPSQSQARPYEPPAPLSPSEKREKAKEMAAEANWRYDDESEIFHENNRAARDEAANSKSRRRENRHVNSLAHPYHQGGRRDVHVGGAEEDDDDEDSGWNSDDNLFIHVAHFSRTARKGIDELPAVSVAAMAARKEHKIWNLGASDTESDLLLEEGGKPGLAQKEMSNTEAAVAATAATHDKVSKRVRNVGHHPPSPAGDRFWETVQEGQKLHNDNVETHRVGSTRGYASSRKYHRPHQAYHGRWNEGGNDGFDTDAVDYEKSTRWGGLELDPVATNYQWLADHRQDDLAGVVGYQSDRTEDVQQEPEGEEQKSSAEPYTEYFAYLKEMQEDLSAVRQDDPFEAQYAAAPRRPSSDVPRRTKHEEQKGRLELVGNTVKGILPSGNEGDAPGILEALPLRVRFDGQEEQHDEVMDQTFNIVGGPDGKTGDGTQDSARFFPAVPGTVEVSRKLRGGRAEGQG